MPPPAGLEAPCPDTTAARILTHKEQMIFNHDRKTVANWNTIDPSLCADCKETLIAKRGEQVIWHWSHRPGNRTRQCEGWCETKWHLKWKQVYQTFENWEIEWPLKFDTGNAYRMDASNPKTGECREFIHSLSPSYIQKHNAISDVCGLNIMWIWDGNEFGSAFAAIRSDKGICNMLKPKADALHNKIGGLVHYNNNLYKHWKWNIWYPQTGDRIETLLKAFNTRLVEERQPKPSIPNYSQARNNFHFPARIISSDITTA